MGKNPGRNWGPRKLVNVQASPSIQLGVVCKLFDLLVEVIHEDVKENWLQYQTLGNTICGWLPTGFNYAHHHSLDPVIQFMTQ